MIHNPSRIMGKMSGRAFPYCSGSGVLPLWALMKNGTPDLRSSAVRKSARSLLWSPKSLGQSKAPSSAAGPSTATAKPSMFTSVFSK